MDLNIVSLIDDWIERLNKKNDFALGLRFTRRNGSLFHPQALPEGFRLDGLGECFRVATLLSSKYPHLTYVEGYAALPEEQWPHLHAWLVDKTGRVIDPTWPKPEYNAYFGVKIPDVLSIVRSSGWTGVFEKPVEQGEGKQWNVNWMFAIDPELREEGEQWELTP